MSPIIFFNQSLSASPDTTVVVVVVVAVFVFIGIVVTTTDLVKIVIDLTHLISNKISKYIKETNIFFITANMICCNVVVVDVVAVWLLW